MKLRRGGPYAKERPFSSDEIASLFDTTRANVYKALSRLKQKLELELEKYYFDLRDSLRHRLERRGLRTVILPKPAIQGSEYPHPDVSFPNCLYHALQYTELNKLSYAELMGYTNYAFKINMYRKKVDAGSMHDWNTFKSNALVNLGFHCNYMDIYNFGLKQHPQKANLNWRAVDMMRSCGG